MRPSCRAGGLGRRAARREVTRGHEPTDPKTGKTPRLADPLHRRPLGGPGAGNACRQLRRVAAAPSTGTAIAQPMPRPFLRTGVTAIQRVTLVVKG